MSFTSLQFIFFLLIVFIVYYTAKQKYQKIILLLSSLIFIGIISLTALFYAIAFAIINFTIGKIIENDSNNGHKKLFLNLGMIFNIGGLVLFKYVNFFIGNINLLSGGLGLNEIPYLNIMLPLGISYYSFQGISYLYLIYKAKDKAEKDIVNFSLYLTFFPKFMAGPIERHRTFLPQLQKNKSFDYDRIVEGLRRILWGAVKIVMIGNALGIIVAKGNDFVGDFKGIQLVIVFLIQPIYLYADFSGYTDMALGLGKVFGFKLTDNFRQPFFACSVGEFWRRWHISLSSWCNEFIYNRLLLKHRKWGEWSSIYAIFFTFMVIGIWHGAKWTYIAVGIIQVIAIIYEYLTRRWRARLTKVYPKKIVQWFSRIIVYLFFCFFLVFFFSNSLSESFLFFTNMFRKGYDLYGFDIETFDFVVAILAFIIVLAYDYSLEFNVKFAILKLHNIKAVRWIVFVLSIVLSFYLLKNQSVFIYSQF